ncbi:MAG: hypothetical protein ACTIJ9_12675 [Aequorivita sp.]
MEFLTIKSLFKIITVSVCCVMMFSSCKREDKYYALSSEAKGFLAYDEGETFRLRNETTDDTITFQVETRTLEFEEHNAPSPHYAWGVSGDTYFEVGHISFRSDEGCVGEIWVEGYYNNEFTVKINLYECFDNMYFQEYEYIGNVEVNDRLYHDAYQFIGPGLLYYSKEKGILQIHKRLTEYNLVE